MLRIAYVIEKFPSDSEYFVLHEIVELKKHGIDSIICALRKPKRKFFLPGFSNPDLPVYYLPVFIVYFLSFIFFTNYRKSIRILYCLFIENRRSLKGCLKELNYFLIASYFSRKIKGVSHVHAHFAFITTDIACVLARILEVEHSFTAHAQDIFLNLGGIQKKVRKASFVVTCTEYNRRFINRLTNNTYQSKVHLVYHGINVEPKRQDPVHGSVFEHGTIHLITVARLVKKKGILYLLKAVELLLHQGMKVNCTIVGDGILRVALETYVQEKGMSNYVEFKGMLSRDKVFEYLQMSDIFVLPCIVDDDGDRDGLPNVLLEAASVGIPIIATNVSAIPEFIENEKTGLLVPEKDENAIANAILKLFQNQALYKDLAKRAKDKIQLCFDISVSARKLRELFMNRLLVKINPKNQPEQ